MKKLFCLILALALTCSFAFAEITSVEELEAMTKEELVTLAADLLGLSTETETTGETADAPAEDSGEYVEVKKGDKSDDVKKVQARLIELGYLSGSADGSYGNGTASAVSKFQSQNNLSVTGVADVETQTLLFSADCPKAVVYGKLDYKGVSRNADDYEGEYVKFDGRILQVIEGDDTLVAFRIASKGRYDDVVYVAMIKPEGYSRLLEDDKVTVYGKYNGLYSYQTVRGDTITIPLIIADTITLK